MEGIHVLVRTDAEQDAPGVQMARQGQLHEDTVDAVILIQSVHQCLQCLLRCVGGQFKALRVKANLLARRLFRT